MSDPIAGVMRIQHVLTTKYGIRNETNKRWNHSVSQYAPIMPIKEPTYDDFMSGNIELKNKLAASEFLILTAQPEIGIIVKTGEREYLFIPSKPEMLRLLKRI